MPVQPILVAIRVVGWKLTMNSHDLIAALQSRCDWTGHKIAPQKVATFLGKLTLCGPHFSLVWNLRRCQLAHYFLFVVISPVEVLLAILIDAFQPLLVFSAKRAFHTSLFLMHARTSLRSICKPCMERSIENMVVLGSVSIQSNVGAIFFKVSMLCRLCCC